MASTYRAGGTGSRLENQERWRTHVLAQQRSSLTQREYCEARDLGYSSFARWRRLLLDRKPSRPPPDDTPGFVPVQVRVEPNSDAPRGGEAGSLSIVLPSGVRIEGVTADAVPAALALVAAL